MHLLVGARTRVRTVARCFHAGNLLYLDRPNRHYLPHGAVSFPLTWKEQRPAPLQHAWCELSSAASSGAVAFFSRSRWSWQRNKTRKMKGQTALSVWDKRLLTVYCCSFILQTVWLCGELRAGRGFVWGYTTCYIRLKSSHSYVATLLYSRDYSHHASYTWCTCVWSCDQSYLMQCFLVEVLLY